MQAQTLPPRPKPEVIIAESRYRDYSLLELINFMLEDLMRIHVYQASSDTGAVVFKNQLEKLEHSQNARLINSISEAYSSSILRLTQQEILEQGYRNIADVLNSFNANTAIYNEFNISGEQRGIAGDYAGMLLILNGRPMQSFASNISVIDAVPLANVVYIEIINGPAGVMFGENAYSGVVNIVTETALKSKDKVSAFADVCLPLEIYLGVQGSKKFLNNWRSSGSIAFRAGKSPLLKNYINSTSYATNDTIYSFLDNSNIEHKLENTYTHIPYELQLDNNNFYIGTSGLIKRTTNKGLYGVTLGTSNKDIQSSNVIYAGWLNHITNLTNLNVEARQYINNIGGVWKHTALNPTAFDSLIVQNNQQNLTTNQIDEFFYTDYSKENLTSSKTSITALFNTVAAEIVKIRFGAEANLSRQALSQAYYYPELFNQIYEFSNRPIRLEDPIELSTLKAERFSAFANAYTLLNEGNLYLGGGLRLLTSNYYNTQLLLRTEIRFNISNSLSVNAKLVQGIQEPTPLHLLNQNITAPLRINTLQPAKNTTVELGLFKVFNNALTGRINLFNQLQQNTFVKSDTSFYYNSNENTVTTTGLEVDLQYQIRRASAFIRLTNLSSNTEGSILYKFRGTSGLSWRPDTKYRIGTRVNFFSKVNQPLQNLLNNTNTIPAYLLADVFISTNKLPLSTTNNNLQAVLSVNNIFNTKQRLPNIHRNGVVEYINQGMQLNFKLIISQ